MTGFGKDGPRGGCPAGPPSPVNFTNRLARDKDWTLPFARAAILEYRRFCFLSVACAEPATPSEDLDEVWHQHLTYSRDYWNVWCAQVLGKPLHHEPTAGAPAEQSRLHRQYASTLARYECFFGPSPEIYWPATHRRFGRRPRFRTYDTARSISLPRPVELLRRLKGAEKSP